MASRTIHDKIPHNVHPGQKVFMGRAQRYKRAADAASAMNSLLQARDSGLPQAEALAKRLLANEKFMAAFNKLLAESGVDVPTAPLTGQGPDHENDEEVLAAAREKEQAGMDSARPILGAADMERVERAHAKLSRLKTAQALGDAGDIVRAQFGMESRAVDADELYAMFEGKRSK
jgi:hypothetical protein